MGDQPVHVGAIGSGMLTKLVHNCASQATQAAIAEVFTMGVKGGCRTFDDLIQAFLPGSYGTHQTPLRLVYKDIKHG